MTFDAREVDAKLDDAAPFPFIGVDGADYSLPNPMSLPTDLFRRITDAYNAGRDSDLFAELEKLVEPETLDAVCAMRIGTTSQLLAEWLSPLADDVGKSLPPRSQPNRAARRSKQTSPSGASTSGRSRRAKQPAASAAS
jgi:hypothetical protein